MASTRLSSLLAELRTLAPKLLFGTASTTYALCGKPGCACHQDDDRRHGPYLRVSFRAGGKTRGYYVPADRQARVREGLEAWARVQAILHELAEENRQALGLGPKVRLAREGQR
jgi:hypothetical protein